MMDAQTHPPTAEQTTILDAARTTDDNLMINALAGCGKTTTLEMIERVVSARPILYLAFNKKIADDASKRMASTTTVRTFNSLGHRIWAKAVNKNLSLNTKKSQELLRGIIDETPRNAQGPIWDSFWNIVNGVGMAKALGYIPNGTFSHARRLCDAPTFHAALDESPDDLTSDLIDAVLIRSIKTAYEGFIDFNDQIYLPALFGGTFPRFPLVKVDEFQDLSPTNHAMLDKLCKHRIIGVGDPWQNIYGFRGAKQGGMGQAQATFKMKELDLSTSFRCPQAVVENARWRVPHFKWMKEGGHVELLESLAPSFIADNAAIICRNNAPLFRTALHLLANKRSVSVAGSDVGPKLLAMMKKIGSDSMSQASFLSAIDDWEAERLSKNSTTAADLAECMRVFAKFGDSKAQALSYAEHLFTQKGTIRLLTGHKAKGLEYDQVFFLDPWLLGQDEQDLNLRYVIQTRSRNRLYEINSRDIRW